MYQRRVVPALAVAALFIGCEHQRDVTGAQFSARGPVIQSVTGSGSMEVQALGGGHWRTFTESARRFADGTVIGQWERVNHVNEAETKSHGVITCFTIEDGNRAYLGGYATSGAWSTHPDNEVGWMVEDNGQGQNVEPDVMTLQWVGYGPGFAERFCRRQVSVATPYYITSGDINVRP